MLSNKLSARQFIRPHKSCLDAIAKISSIEGNIQHMGRNEVFVLPSPKEEVMKKILNNKLLKR